MNALTNTTRSGQPYDAAILPLLHVKPDRKKLRNHILICPRMPRKRDCRKRTASSQRQGQQQLIREMLTGNCGRHKIGPRIADRFRSDAFRRHAKAPEGRAAAMWSGNFRDLNAAVARMGTLSQGARISVDLVHEEIQRLRNFWSHEPATTLNGALVEVLRPEQLTQLDLFDRLQLERVVEICRQSRSLSEAGRTLFHVSRSKKATSNDADRLRKYLARFSLDWSLVR